MVRDVSIPLGPEASCEFTIYRYQWWTMLKLAAKAIYHGRQKVAFVGPHILVIKGGD